MLTYICDVDEYVEKFPRDLVEGVAEKSLLASISRIIIGYQLEIPLQ